MHRFDVQSEKWFYSVLRVEWCFMVTQNPLNTKEIAASDEGRPFTTYLNKQKNIGTYDEIETQFLLKTETIIYLIRYEDRRNITICAIQLAARAFTKGFGKISIEQLIRQYFLYVSMVHTFWCWRYVLDCSMTLRCYAKWTAYRSSMRKQLRVSSL